MLKKVLFFALLPLLLSAAMPEKPFVLARNGKAACQIVLSEKANKFDKMAAKDLQSYLGKITGAKFNIVSEKRAKGNAVYVGNTSAGKKYAPFKDEEWCISSPDGKKLILTGGARIGGFYAVWDFLNELGCYALTFDQDAIPSDKNLTWNGKFIRRKPAFNGRLIFDGFPHQQSRVKTPAAIGEKYRMWVLRSRINGEQSKKRIPSYYTYSSFNLMQSYPYHSLSLYVPPEKYFKTHPEYFSMNEFGKRFKPESFAIGGGLCESNPEVVKVVLQSLREMIKEHRAKYPKEEWGFVYDISRLDRMPYICRCPECVKIIKEEGSESGLHFRFINTISREIRKEYPDIIIRTNGKYGTNPPPTKTKLDPEVLMHISDKFTVSDPFRPLSHPINAAAKAELEKWFKVSKRLALWDYWNLGGGTYFQPPRVETVIDALQSDFKYFVKSGVTELFIEISRDHHSPQNFIDCAYFVGNQLMVNPDQDVEKLIKVYFKHYYGPAAPALLKWFNEIRAGVKTQPTRQPSMGAGNWNYATIPFLFNAYKMLKEQAEKLPETSVYRKRVEFERTTVIWSILSQRASFEKVFKRNGMDINDLVAECRALAKKHIRRWGGDKFKKIDEAFEKRFLACTYNLKKPEKFKDVPDEKFRMIAFPHFRNVRVFQTVITDDPDSIQGRAAKSGHPNPAYHGVDIRMPGKHNFRSTFFQLNSRGNSVQVRLKKVPQDEKYHWFQLRNRKNPKIELQPKATFWGHGWAIQAKADHLYMLTDGTAADNVWDEVWVSAKFTGPAYVPGSKKENAIWVDMMVLVRR